MRLQRLEIPGFGSLRDCTVEFDLSFTVLLGANESGKTTVHRAVRAALYGLDAGGQGRPVDRSDWNRWTPWTPGPYGVGLTYSLADGRIVRVARRFDSREQEVQVLELGGSDLTDDLRRGRLVVPGLYHLGIDEAVFCATAWLGDDGLRLGAPEAVDQRSASLQEAIERLADSRRGITAAAAIARLRDALREIGTERRATSPLGAATLRLRELETQVREARARLAERSLELDRLRALDQSVAIAVAANDEAEAALLAARLGAVEHRLAQLAAAGEERSAAERVIAETRGRASFPVDLENRVTVLAGELSQAERTAADAGSLVAGSAAALSSARTRQAEVQAGLGAAARAPLLDAGLEPDLAAAQHSFKEVYAAAEELRSGAAADARVLALRQEIARTGLGALPLGAAASVADLVRAARARRSVAGLVLAALGLLAAGLAGGVVAWQRHAVGPGGIAVGVAVALAVATGAWAAMRLRRARVAAAEIALLEERLGVSAGDLDQVRDRVPALQALHAALLREESVAAGRRAEAEAVAEGARALLQRCEGLAFRAGLKPTTGAGGTVAAILDRCADLLDRLAAAVALQRRRDELQSELERLDAQVAAYEAMVAEQERARAEVRRIRDRLDRALADGGLPPGASPEAAVASVQGAAEQRRRFDAARRGLTAATQRGATMGDPALLERAAAELRAELVARCRPAVGDPTGADESALHRFDLEARRSRQAAATATIQARELGARLEGALEGQPDLADLEDQRDACAVQRERCLHRQRALLRAVALVEGAARGTHRDLAPRLARWVAEHLDALTESRYRAVNVDTDHFTVSLLCRDRPDMVPLELVSHGTRDQVALLLRLALCDALNGASEPAPLLLDEPLLTADPGRRTAMLQFLHNLSATHQVVLSTADPAIAEAARDVTGGGCSVVRIGSGSSEGSSARHAVRVAG